MKAKLSISRKILLFWGASVLLVIALVGGIFLISLNSYHEKVAGQNISNAHDAFLKFIQLRQDHLQNISKEFVARRSVIATMNLLTTYQDHHNYEPLVYDPEKKKLTELVGAMTGISGHHFVAIYDARLRLSVFHDHETGGETAREINGIMSYQDGQPVLMVTKHGENSYQRSQKLPQGIAIASDTMDTGRFLIMTNNGLAVVVRTPISRVRPSGKVELLGTMVLVDILNDAVMAELSRQTGLRVGYTTTINNEVRKFGASPDNFSTPHEAPLIFDGQSAHEMVSNANGYIGFSKFPLHDTSSVIVTFMTPNADLMTGISAFRDSAVWGALIFLLIMTPVGLIFIRQVVSKPLSSLMSGVETIVQGRYGDTIDLASSDELGILARSFNDMSRVIKEREDGLEETVHLRTVELENEISGRKIFEFALKENEAKTRQIVNSAVDGIITTDMRGTIATFNAAAEKIFGYSVIEVIGKNISILMPKNQAENHDTYLSNYLEKGQGRVIGMSRELVAKRKDDTTFLADFAISEFNHNDKTNFVGIIRDITERKDAEYKLQSALQDLKKTQSVLVEAEKMASLGGLVAGVAHEINTPIGVGLTAATHLKEQAHGLALKFSNGQLKKSDFQNFIDTATQSTNIVEANLNRASELIRSFKQVAVDQSSEQNRTISLLDYIEEVLKSLQPKLKQTKHTISVDGDRTIQITTNPGALSQIVTNLVMNSVIHAYGDDDAGQITISVHKDGDSLSLTYMDDGKGMDEDVSAKIFEPFFTTKRGSGGSGLGMHILYNQVTQTLGGSIDLHSTPGKGTAFDITIPVQNEA